MIKPKFWDDTKLCKISRDARLTFIAMWNFADDLGVIVSNPVWLKSKIYPTDNIQIQQFSKWLSELENLGFISPLSFNDEGFYYLPNFTKHQTIDRPNYDEVFIPTIELERVLKDSPIIRGLIVDESRLSKEKKSKVNTVDFVNLVNGLVGKRCRINDKISKQWAARVKDGFTLDDISIAVKNAMANNFHKENNFQYLTPEFFTRADVLDKWLNASKSTVGYLPPIQA